MPTAKTQLDHKTRKAVLDRDNHVCRKCGRSDGLECHHIIPRRAGGSDELENLIVLCIVCHQEWGLVEDGVSLTFDEWLAIPHYAALVALYQNVPPELRAGTCQAWQLHKDLR